MSTPDHAALDARMLQAQADGALRALDVALARFMAEHAPAAAPSLVWASACLGRAESLGHSCLDLPAVAADAPGLLGWSAAQHARCADLMALLPRDAESAMAAWAGPHGGPRFVETGIEAAASRCMPLVLHGGRLYLRRQALQEARVAQQLLQRAARPAGGHGHADADAGEDGNRYDDADGRAMRRAAAAELERLFGREAGAPGTADQRRACEQALNAALSVITGGPGTGKTFTAARLLSAWCAGRKAVAPAAPLRIGLAAPTGKAAARLRQSIADGLARDAAPGSLGAADLQPAVTLHALLGARAGSRAFARDEDHPLDLDLLLVDEASMIHLALMDALLRALPPRTPLVLLGDRDQLASVEAGSVMGDLCAAAALGATSDLARQTSTLRHSHRFGGPIGALAAAVNRGDAPAALRQLRGPAPGHDDAGAGAAPAGEHERPPHAAALAWIHGSDARERLLQVAVHGREGQGADGFRAFARAVTDRRRDAAHFADDALAAIHRFERCRVLCALREGPWGAAGINAAIEQALHRDGLLDTRGHWYDGRPVMVMRNEPSLGLFNGDIGIVLHVPGGAQPDGERPEDSWRVCFADGPSLRTVAVSRLPPVETAYAMTVHKSQGSEFAHVVLALPPVDVPVLTRELVYTGITRARQALTLACTEAEVLAAAVGRLTRRMSGLVPQLASLPAPPPAR